MRVLLTTDPIGGVWTFTRDLTNQFLACGHKVALVSYGRELSASQAAWCAAMRATHGSGFCFAASSVPLEWMQDNSQTYLRGLQPLLEVARAFRPEIVHTSQFCFGRLPLPVPVVVTAHSDVLSWAEACSPQSLTPSPWLAHYMRLTQGGLDDASAVVAPTLWMLAALSRNFRIAAQPSVIFNGRDLPVAPLAKQALQAISVGRLWDKGKNIALLAELKSSVPLTVVGEKSHEGVDTQHVAGGLRMLDALDGPALLSLFRASSLYVAPSIYEPFGLAPVEAALCGCALVANDLASLREVWGDAALYFRTAHELSEIVTYLGNNPDILLARRERAQNHARRMTAAKMAAAYLALYESLLALPAGVKQAEEGAYVG